MTQKELSIEEFSQLAQQIEAELRRVIVGQDVVIRDVMITVLAGRHILLEGMPGLGKTLLIRTLADVLDLAFSRIQFTPDMMPADITGTNIMEEGDDGRKQFRFQRGPIFANLILADEINRATPKTQSALLEAMQEKTVTVGGEQHHLSKPFFVMATQNPIEQEGTYPLPEAQLDRFMFKVDSTFPSVEELVTIINRTTGLETPTAQKVVDGAQIVKMGELALQTPIASHVGQYVAELIVATHPEHPNASAMVKRFVGYGASPRGAQALVIGAKINALLDGRFNVSFDDVSSVARSALQHRLLLNFEGMAEGIKTGDIVADLLTHVAKISG
jgi:MoxR-like ATPase